MLGVRPEPSAPVDPHSIASQLPVSGSARSASLSPTSGSKSAVYTTNHLIANLLPKLEPLGDYLDHSRQHGGDLDQVVTAFGIVVLATGLLRELFGRLMPVVGV